MTEFSFLGKLSSQGLGENLIGDQLDAFRFTFFLSVSVMCSLTSSCLGTVCKYFVYFFIYENK